MDNLTYLQQLADEKEKLKSLIKTSVEKLEIVNKKIQDATEKCQLQTTDNSQTPSEKILTDQIQSIKTKVDKFMSQYPHKDYVVDVPYIDLKKFGNGHGRRNRINSMYSGVVRNQLLAAIYNNDLDQILLILKSDKPSITFYHMHNIVRNKHTSTEVMNIVLEKYTSVLKRDQQSEILWQLLIFEHYDLFKKYFTQWGGKVFMNLDSVRKLHESQDGFVNMSRKVDLLIEVGYSAKELLSSILSKDECYGIADNYAYFMLTNYLMEMIDENDL